jgi:hypothetical protein
MIYQKKSKISPAKIDFFIAFLFNFAENPKINDLQL